MGFLVYFCMIYMPTPVIYRPHPAFWRMVTGFGLCYLLTLLFMLSLTREQLMLFFKKVFDSNLGKPLPERSYADHCEIYTPYDQLSKFRNIWDSLDMYVAAHSLGWFFKMMIIRDWRMCMLLQVGFEYMELTFRHWLPNFYECWWDSIVFDVLVCNSLGIVAGHYFMKLFQMRVTQAHSLDVIPLWEFPPCRNTGGWALSPSGKTIPSKKASQFFLGLLKSSSKIGRRSTQRSTSTPFFSWFLRWVHSLFLPLELVFVPTIGISFGSSPGFLLLCVFSGFLFEK